MLTSALWPLNTILYKIQDGCCYLHGTQVNLSSTPFMMLQIKLIFFLIASIQNHHVVLIKMWNHENHELYIGPIKKSFKIHYITCYIWISHLFIANYKTDNPHHCKFITKYSQTCIIQIMADKGHFHFLHLMNSA